MLLTYLVLFLAGPAFATAANAAFGSTLNPAFDPYANELFMYHGGFIFEDVGVGASLPPCYLFRVNMMSEVWNLLMWKAANPHKGILKAMRRPRGMIGIAAGHHQ